jgi:hypothetical protein
MAADTSIPAIGTPAVARGSAARPDADLQATAAAGQLAREHLDDALQRVGGQRARLIVVLGGAVERDATGRIDHPGRAYRSAAAYKRPE